MVVVVVVVAVEDEAGVEQVALVGEEETLAVLEAEVEFAAAAVAHLHLRLPPLLSGKGEIAVEASYGFPDPKRGSYRVVR